VNESLVLVPVVCVVCVAAAVTTREQRCRFHHESANATPIQVYIAAVPHFWPPPADATPVNGWGELRRPGSQNQEMISVPAGKRFALASLTLSDNSDPNPTSTVTIQLETAAPSSGGQLGAVISQFAHLTLALGTNLPITFPAPLVLSSPHGEAFVFRAIVVEERVVSSYEVNILAVGYIF
jgi:hypothetical protein